jgi:hypothetical protein
MTAARLEQTAAGIGLIGAGSLMTGSGPFAILFGVAMLAVALVVSLAANRVARDEDS